MERHIRTYPRVAASTHKTGGGDTLALPEGLVAALSSEGIAPPSASGYLVAALPAGTAGDIANVTDGDSALTWGATVINSGSGATPYMVWFNGTNWTVAGK
jgi:hypothetical protein